MRKIVAVTKQYPLAAFFVLTFIFTHGVFRIADGIYSATNSFVLALPLALLGAGPLASALIVSAVINGNSGVFALVRKFTVWRVGLRWYLIALFLLPALHVAAIYLNVSFGAPAPAAAAFGPWTALLGTFAIRLVNPWDGPVTEELGWRGFALPRMQSRYPSPLTANLILGILVTLWHLPLIPFGGYEWIYVPGTMAATILFGWVYNATGGSVLLTLIMHAVEPLLQVSFSGADATRYMGLLVLVYVVTATIVVLLTGKNLGWKESPTTETVVEPAAAAI